MQSVADQWEKMARAVLPPSVQGTQRREMRRAFYAGFAAAMGTMVAIVEECGEDADGARGSAKMDDLNLEMATFSLDVIDGRA